ncbi:MULTISPECIES: site-specific integrase [unclassified Caballeronia]|uniref:tyrosine-type recombinase/integrase n=1 Tax=unclassified Caballeronia TaxID=2646786 RepID=UPI00285BC856|nr:MULTISPECIES: site-specific integrase [unclassified Caballeronia]MDR5776977.1 site-specific integrase [Caballeronia sp. LZ002]MDR5852448.1 site-specific integrase [Caballeronia sp. LZ003]
MTQSIESYVGQQLPSPLPRNRAESPILPSGLTDEDAVIRWLQTKSAGDGRLAESTLAQYVVEARRLFWYARWVSRPISEWTLDDAASYLAFLRAPDERTICPARVRRDDLAWTPFRKALSADSARQSQVIAGSLFKWLVDMQYLRANPFAGFGLMGKRSRGAKKQSRFLDHSALDLARSAIESRACTSDRQRAKKARDLFVLDLFAKVGLRTSEATGATMGAVRYAQLTAADRARDPDGPSGVWVIDVTTAKGGFPRTVSFAAVMGRLQAYRVAYGLSPLPSAGETTPLILGARRRTPDFNVDLPDRRMRNLREDLGQSHGVTNRSSVYRLVKDIFREALDYWAARDPIDAENLRKASTHWLRHTFAKSMVDAGGGVVTVSRNLGHADMNTTLTYVDDEELKRARDTERLIR